MRLTGKTVVIIIAEGYHEHEFWFPYYRFKEEGANVIVAAMSNFAFVGRDAHIAPPGLGYPYRP